MIRARLLTILYCVSGAPWYHVPLVRPVERERSDGGTDTDADQGQPYAGEVHNHLARKQPY